MADRIALEVATPAGLALDVEVEAVEAPSVEGEFGVLPGHLPLLAALKAGLLKYHVDGRVHVAAIGPGFAEVEPDRVTVLTDAFAVPARIDPATVRAEHDAAERALAAFPEFHEGAEFEERRRALEWAVARLDAAAYREP